MVVTTEQVEATAQAVRDAEAHVAAMRDALAQLEDQARSGAEVDPAELGRHDDLIRLASLRVDAARAAADQARAADRARRYTELGDRARAIVGEDQRPILAAHSAAVAALTELFRLAQRRRADVDTTHRAARQLAKEASQHGERDQLTAAGIGDLRFWLSILTADGIRRDTQPVAPEMLAAHALATVLHAGRVERSVAVQALGKAMEDTAQPGWGPQHQLRQQLPDLPTIDKKA